MTDTLPPIVMSETDFDFLSNLTAARGGALSEVMSFLEQELDRADVLPDRYVPLDAVRLHSRITYRDGLSGQTRSVTLVYPQEEDSELGHVSVLTPVGAALIGLRPGQHIAWQSWAGTARSLEVLTVDPA
jgi:regulator of nucleoside diphosphate kinase